MKYAQLFQALKVTMMGKYTKLHLEHFPKNLFGETIDNLESLVSFDR